MVLAIRTEKRQRTEALDEVFARPRAGKALQQLLQDPTRGDDSVATFNLETAVDRSSLCLESCNEQSFSLCDGSPIARLEGRLALLLLLTGAYPAASSRLASRPSRRTLGRVQPLFRFKRLAQRRNLKRGRVRIAAQGERPDAGIDQQCHERERAAL
jgi:hypothetical protein